MRWIAITEIENIPAREGRAVRLKDCELAVLNLNGRVRAVDNRCPHKGGPLCDGIISDATVVCPLHGRRFDLNTGMAVRSSKEMCVATYATKVEDGIIYLDLESSSLSEESATTTSKG